MKRLFVLVLTMAITITACAGQPTATPLPPTATPIPPTDTPVPPTNTPVPPPTDTPIPPTATPATLSISALTELLRPSTVLIYAQFAGDEAATGTGIIYTEDGYAVTNAHVVEGAAILKVYVPGNNRWLSAKLIGISPCDDLAVIDIAGAGFTPAILGESDDLKLGEELVALGYPLASDLGNDLTVTRGIVSKLHAQLDQLEDLIQTDASINPGNSGGPLVNMKGEVIGINTSKVEYTSSGRPVQGLNFAIGASFAKTIIKELEQEENLHWVGINAISNNTEIADYFGLQTATGLIVYATASGSPAEKTGFLPGDVVVTVEGVTVNSQADLCDILKSHRADEVLEVEVVRGNTLLTGQLGGTPLPTPGPVPIIEPVIGDITFATDVTDDDKPINPGTTFPPGTTKVYGFFEYADIRPGAQFAYIWYLDEKEDASDVSAWSKDRDSPGSYWVNIYNDDGLTPGSYELHLYVDDELLQTGDFVIREPLQLQDYANTDWGFAIKYPAHWEMEMDEHDQLVFSDPNADIAFVVKMIELETAVTPVALLDKLMEGFKGSYPDLETIDTQEDTVDGSPAAVTGGEYTHKGKEGKIMVISIVRDDFLWYYIVMLGTANDFDRVFATFTDDIMGSFNFLALSAPSKPPEPVQLQSYTSELRGFTVKYPADWEVEVEEGETLFAFSAPDDADIGFFVTGKEAEGTATPVELADSFMEKFKEGYPDLEVLVDTQEDTVDGFPAAVTGGRYTSDGEEAKIMVVAVLRDNLAYYIVLLGTADGFSRMVDTFTDDIMGSFNFIDLKAN